MATESNQPPLVVVVGQTAPGKSALALSLAERFNGEIICADPWTVRREVNIGTAKPSAEEQRRVPHHLLDIVDPCEDFTAAVFKRLANQTIKQITARGKLPIMVGGTGLYIDSVLFDYSFLPASDSRQRQALNALTIPALLAIIDQEGLSLEGIDIRNKRRLIRLIEAGGARPARRALRSNSLILETVLPRDELTRRISRRVDAMLQQGLAEEVRRLADSYGWECEALKGIGYREWQPFFAGSQDLEQTRARIVSATLGLAKRQRTWFKRNTSINRIYKTEDAVDLVTTFLNK